MKKRNNLISKFLICNKQIRIYILQGSQIKQELKDKIGSNRKMKYMLEALNITALLASLNSDEQRFSLRFMSKDLKYKISTEGFSNKTITGLMTVDDEEHAFTGGSLQVIRSIDGQYGSSYTSFTSLETGDLFHDIGKYYKDSEQIPTCFIPINANEIYENFTILIQELPFASEGIFEAAVEKTLQNKFDFDFSSTASIQETVLKVYQDAMLLEVKEILYSCGCTKEMFLGLIFSLTKEEQEDIMEQNINLEANCSICGKEYYFTPEEIVMYLK